MFFDCVCYFFFFKQKTAYEIMPSLVGSEMCIRDRSRTGGASERAVWRNFRDWKKFWPRGQPLLSATMSAASLATPKTDRTRPDISKMPPNCSPDHNCAAARKQR